MVEILHNHSRRGFDTSCKVKTTLTPRAVHLTPMESLWEMRTLFLASLFQISPRWKKPSVPQKMNKQQSMEPWGSPGKREARSKELKDSSRHQAQWKKPLRELEEVMLRKRHALKVVQMTFLKGQNAVTTLWFAGMTSQVRGGTILGWWNCSVSWVPPVT